MFESESTFANLHDAAGDLLPLAGPSVDPGLRFGDYLLEEEIAHGGMGVVYRARQLSLGRVVAVKLMLLGRHSSAESIERFKREAQSVAALRHPHIVSIYEVGQCDGQHFFAMEYVDGQNLAELLRGGPFAARHAAELTQDIADAIHYAHSQGVLHRDLKPSNVLIDPLGQVRITDFGLAKKLDGSSDLTLTGQMMGTPNYLSPEQAAGKHAELGPASDVYAIGALLYELLTGRPPFLAQSLQDTLLSIRDAEPVPPHSLNPSIHRDLETICLKCLRKEPSRRYATAQAVAEDLERWLQQLPIAARPTGSVERAWLWSKRKPHQASMFLTLTLVLATGVAGVLTQWQRAERNRRIAENHSRRLEAERVTSRRQLYASDMSAALAAFKEGNLGLTLRLLERHRPDPSGVDRPSGRSDEDLRGFEWRYLWSRVQGDQVLVLRGHSNLVSCLSFSPDGHYLASGDADGVVKLWDLRTGLGLTNLYDFSGRALSTSFSYDGRYLAAGGWTSVRFWDRTAGAWTLLERTAQARAVFSPVEPTVVLSSERYFWFGAGGEAQLWNYSGSRSNVTRLPRSGARVSFSADGRLLASGLEDWKIYFWDAATGQAVGQPIQATNLKTLALARDGRWLAAAVDDSDRVRVWSAPDGEWLGDLLGHELRVIAVAASPVADLLASAGEDQTIRLWDMNTRRVITTFSGHGSEVHALAFSRDGEWLASGSKDETVRLWKVAADHSSDVLTNVSCQGGLRIPILSPDGRLLAANSHSDKLALFNVGTHRPVWTLASRRRPIAFSPDGHRLISITTAGLLEGWDVTTGRQIGEVKLRINPHRESRTCLSPDGSIVAVSTGFEMVLCDTSDGRQRAALSGHRGLILGAAFSPKGTHIATVCQDGVARVWNVEDGSPYATLHGHKADVRGVAFSVDGRWLATAGYDNLIKVWEVAARQERFTLRGHKAPIHWLVFTPDGRTLISAGDDALRLWNVPTWREIGPIETGKRCQLLALAGNGSVLAAGDASATNLPVRLFRVPEWADVEPDSPRAQNSPSRLWLLWPSASR
jgi:WD40 repeat protein/predicted Ser/Thr protein kinase